METLLERSDQLDGIVVETSGLALPRPLLQALDWPAIRRRVHVNGVVTVVDGEALSAGSPVGDPDALERQRQEDQSLDHLTAIEDLFEDQLQAADLVLISRSDQLQPSELARVVQTIEPRVRPGAGTLAMSRGEIDPALVLGLDAPESIHSDHHEHEHEHHDHDDAHHDHDHHDHSHVEAVSGQVRLEGAFDRKTLEELLPQFVRSNAVIRLKGRVWLAGKTLPLQIQMVGPRLDSWFEAAPDQAWVPDTGSGVEFVVIGLRPESAELLSAELQACR